ncbi:MAG: Clp protease N-terminal domain-containing protein, partial [Planctomycetota bacterium]
MVEVDLKALVSRLNRFATRALEAAAGNCVSRTNYEVTVEHLMQALSDDPSGDVQQILAHFDIDPGRLIKTLSRDLDGLKTGNANRPVFSPLLTTWFQQAWLVASITHGQGEIRSANLLEALLSNPARLATGSFVDVIGEISVAELRKELLNIVSGSR